MKILFVLNSGFDTPGPSNHLLESIIEKLLLEGDKVHIIGKHKTGQNPDIPESIAENKNLTYDIHKVKNIKKMNFKNRYIADIKYAISIIKHYRKQRDVDVVFLQSCNTAFFHVIFLKLFLKKPIVYNVQDIFPLNAMLINLLDEKSIAYKLLNFLQINAYKMASKIITISEDMKDTIVSYGIERKKIEVIHNWSYTDKILNIHDENNKILIDNNIDGDHFKIVYAGNIGTVQNVETILGAAKLLKENKNIYFYIFGDGVNKSKCKKIVKENNLSNVIFYPMQLPKYAAHIYSMADINIIPLKEGIIKTALPSKTAICLSVGKPIIACVDKDSKFAESISSCENSEVVNSDDIKGLATYIEKYYHNNIQGYSKDLRNLFKKNFSRSLNTNKYLDELRKLNS